ncbi:MAG: hypothetical protein Q8L66_12095 [Caulobacter sp.]|nr:hypothetical protein [Caulobacter sp.]
MTITSVVLVAVSLLAAGVFFQPRLLGAVNWRATVTPLASIIGSGFLIAGPILSLAAGRLAWLAMLGLCAAGYLFGEAIRHNIVHVEPELDDAPSAGVRWIERASQLALSLAYFVSVAYYLNLFAAFGLRLGAVTDPFWVRVTATVVIGGVGVIGLLGGLKALERLEVGAVGLKLSVIAGLFAALILASLLSLKAGTFAWHAPDHPHGLTELRILLGLVILVQGFETSRYLGDAYDAPTRVRTMRWAQLIATGIYLVFMLLITAYFTRQEPAAEATAIIDMLAPLGLALAPMIILAALASQLSAAVADTNGAGGLVSESLNRRIPVNIGNAITAAAAIVITWTADIYQIVTWASQVFVAYYALQSAQAAWSAWRQKRFWRALLFAGGVLLAVVIVVFAIPAEV